MIFSVEAFNEAIERKRAYYREYRHRKKVNAAIAEGRRPPPLHGNSFLLRNRTPAEKIEARKRKDRERKRIKRRKAKEEAKKEEAKANVRQPSAEPTAPPLDSPVFRLATEEEMARVTSWFALHNEQFEPNLEYVLYLPRWEIYSVKENAIHLHGRHILDITGMNGTQREPVPGGGKVWVVIDADAKQYLDHRYDVMHVAREGSDILEDTTTTIYQNGRLTNIDFSFIVNGLYTHGVGEGDPTRSPDSRRINLSYQTTGDPIAFRRIQKVLGGNAREFFTQVGRIAEFVCQTMLIMQDDALSGHPIWRNKERDFNFARRLRLRLFLDEDSFMKGEMVAVCVMKITGTIPRNIEHIDVKNPALDPEYNRSGTFNAVVAGEDGHLYLLQVIVASRNYGETVGARGYIVTRNKDEH